MARDGAGVPGTDDGCDRLPVASVLAEGGLEERGLFGRPATGRGAAGGAGVLALAAAGLGFAVVFAFALFFFFVAATGWCSFFDFAFLRGSGRLGCFVEEEKGKEKGRRSERRSCRRGVVFAR